VVDRIDDFACIDSLELDGSDPEVRMPELPLNDRQWNPFVRHLNRVRVSQLVRREPPPHTGPHSKSRQLSPRGCR
jgi:hypothetical protein